MKADLELWRKLYGVTSFFVDEMANEAAPQLLQYYADLRKAAAGGFLVGNPGCEAAAEYVDPLSLRRRIVPTALQRVFAFADVLVLGEQTAGVLQSQLLPATARGGRSGYLIHTCPGESQPPGQLGPEAMVSLARQAGASMLYLTDKSMPDPWSGLPAYWDRLVEAVRRA